MCSLPRLSQRGAPATDARLLTQSLVLTFNVSKPANSAVQRRCHNIWWKCLNKRRQWTAVEKQGCFKEWIKKKKRKVTFNNSPLIWGEGIGIFRRIRGIKGLTKALQLVNVQENHILTSSVMLLSERSDNISQCQHSYVMVRMPGFHPCDVSWPSLP